MASTEKLEKVVHIHWPSNMSEGPTSEITIKNAGTIHLPKLVHSSSSSTATSVSGKLSADSELSEVDLLRSRISEQSELIMILKKRSDESVFSARNLERLNSELKKSLEEVKQELDAYRQKYDVLDGRFSYLASNHQEMIKFKDEYKRRNLELMEENERLRNDNVSLFSATIEEKTKMVSELQRTNNALKIEMDLLNKQLQECHKRLSETESRSVRELEIANGLLNDNRHLIEDLTASRNRLMAERATTDIEYQSTLSKLTKDKDELLALSVSRGKIIQEKQLDMKKLQQKVEDTEKEMQRMQEKFDQTLASVSVAVQVQRLNQTINEMQLKHQATLAEMEAVKKHFQTLLQQEKDLNARLRHLVE